MKQRLYYLTALILIGGAEFFLSNELLRGYMRAEEYLARELKTPVESLQEFRLAKEAPFRFRLVFAGTVKGTHRLFYDERNPDGFFEVYRFWSVAFFVSSACALFWLLAVCGFSDGQSFAGAIIFLLLPPMLMAYTLPVHTREDTLGYTLLFAGLAFLLKEKRWAFLAVAVIGAMTRETLLLLSVLYFFYGRDERMARRWTISALPVLVWLSIRYTGRDADYDPWLGIRWNLDNPGQVVGFLFLTFNALWLTFALHFRMFRNNTHFITSNVRFFYRSSTMVLVLLLVTTFAGGIFNEIRLMYLFAPWMIVIFLDCYGNYSAEFKRVLGMKNYWLFAAAAFALCVAVTHFALRNREAIIPSGKWAVPYDQWIVLSVCYIFILMLITPQVLSIISLKKPAK